MKRHSDCRKQKIIMTGCGACLGCSCEVVDLSFVPVAVHNIDTVMATMSANTC